MRWLVLLLLASPVSAATLPVRFTLPDQDNWGSCTAPALIPMGTNGALKGHWRWWVAGGDSVSGATEDSLAAPPASPISKDYAVPAGLYRVRAWATDLGGVGCDTTVTKSSFKYPPWKPRWSP